MSNTIAAMLRKVPPHLFWKEKRGGRAPDYGFLFAFCLQEWFEGEQISFEELCDRIASGEGPNVSTFQRAVAMESKIRKEQEP